MEKKQIHWEILIGMILVIGTILGVTVPLHIQTNDRIASAQEQTNDQIAGIRQEITGIRQDVMAIHQEMKDFHGRLCAIEERYRSK